MHCVWEIIDNAVDEALGGFGDAIEVTLGADGSVSVTDQARHIFSPGFGTAGGAQPATERERIADALIRHDGHRKAAAADLGISERTLYRKIREYDLE